MDVYDYRLTAPRPSGRQPALARFGKTNGDTAPLAAGLPRRLAVPGMGPSVRATSRCFDRQLAAVKVKLRSLPC